MLSVANSVELSLYIAAFAVLCLICAFLLDWWNGRCQTHKKRRRQQEKFKTMTDKEIHDFIKRF